jgi:hypothetical protein
MWPLATLLRLTAVAAVVCLPARPLAGLQADPALDRGRRLTGWLLDGQIDSLHPRMATAFQASIGGRPGLARFLEQVGSLGPSWELRTKRCIARARRSPTTASVASRSWRARPTPQRVVRLLRSSDSRAGGGNRQPRDPRSRQRRVFSAGRGRRARPRPGPEPAPDCRHYSLDIGWAGARWRPASPSAARRWSRVSESRTCRPRRGRLYWSHSSNPLALARERSCPLAPASSSR